MTGAVIHDQKSGILNGILRVPEEVLKQMKKNLHSSTIILSTYIFLQEYLHD